MSIEDRVLEILKKRPQRAGSVGVELWGDAKWGDGPRPCDATRRFARAAGKILRRMQRAGIIGQDPRCYWYSNPR